MPPQKALQPNTPKRPGRPRTDASATMTTHPVTLTRDLAEKARRLGNGNLSAGVRIALESAGTTP